MPRIMFIHCSDTYALGMLSYFKGRNFQERSKTLLAVGDFVLDRNRLYILLMDVGEGGLIKRAKDPSIATGRGSPCLNMYKVYSLDAQRYLDAWS